MSLAIMNLVLKCDPEKRMHPSQKFVLLMIANNASDEGVAFISIPRIAAQTNLAERSVLRAIEYLETAGHITIKPRPGRASAYVIHPVMPDGSAATPDTVAVVGDRASRGTRSATNAHACESTSRDTRGAPRVANVSASDATKGEGARNVAAATPDTVAGAQHGGGCGSVVHTGDATSGAPVTVSPLPLTPCHPPPTQCHPSPSLLHQSTSLFLGGPDDLKNRGTESKSPEEFERTRREQLDRIDRALAAKGVAA